MTYPVTIKITGGSKKMSQQVEKSKWGVRALTGMFIGPLEGPWAKIVLAHLKKLEKSWKIRRKFLKNCKKNHEKLEVQF